MESSALQGSAKHFGDIDPAPVQLHGLVEMFSEQVVMGDVLVVVQYGRSAVSIPWLRMKLLQPLCRLPCERQGFFATATLPRQPHTVGRDPRRSQHGGTVGRL